LYEVNKPALRVVKGGAPPKQASPALEPVFDPYASEAPPLTPDPIDFSDLRAEIEVLLAFLELSWQHPRIKAWLEATQKAAQLKGIDRHYLPYSAYEKLRERLKEQRARLKPTEALLYKAGLDWQHPRIKDFLTVAKVSSRGALSAQQLDGLDRALESLIRANQTQAQ
jgi:hypothetical protein